MIRHPPISTLFPYPTLSGSPWPPPAVTGLFAAAQHVVDQGPVPVVAIGTDMVEEGLVDHICPNCYDRNRPLIDDMLGSRDRKSTRLNSSHGYISYAVFCLKK